MYLFLFPPVSLLQMPQQKSGQVSQNSIIKSINRRSLVGSILVLEVAFPTNLTSDYNTFNLTKAKKEVVGGNVYFVLLAI